MRSNKYTSFCSAIDCGHTSDTIEVYEWRREVAVRE